MGEPIRHCRGFLERGNHLAYPVGDREEAERQVQLALNHPSDETAA